MTEVDNFEIALLSKTTRRCLRQGQSMDNDAALEDDQVCLLSRMMK